jgi:hypothetical protein
VDRELRGHRLLRRLSLSRSGVEFALAISGVDFGGAYRLALAAQDLDRGPHRPGPAGSRARVLRGVGCFASRCSSLPPPPALLVLGACWSRLPRGRAGRSGPHDRPATRPPGVRYSSRSIPLETPSVSPYFRRSSDSRASAPCAATSTYTPPRSRRPRRLRREHRDPHQADVPAGLALPELAVVGQRPDQRTADHARCAAIRFSGTEGPSSCAGPGAMPRRPAALRFARRP